ncbi:hypothetical protein HME9304_00226 [Flagellimonas maritima]|uniref:Uncharacterized protein n=1 Tax=Flagellimonas maritima TaxID=1383885 RepID=A0A2Z4LNC9_9FLAO|nr:hypothetical protein [Allomuricauda aurantiaca]AWX43239.1 hypothetical protein HME9304_00226 [Allomuricauda aurantiaca]
MNQVNSYSLLLFFILISAEVQSMQHVKDSIVLKNKSLKLVQNLHGGAITSLEFKDNPVNPFDWSLPVENQPEINKDGFAFRGHFISLGTWGMPTEGEQNAGIRLYGEPTAQIWKRNNFSIDSLGNKILKTGFRSKIEGLSLERKITLYQNEALIQVKESVTNDLPISRVYNFLQHPTFGGAFVSKNLRIDTNAGKGFYQKGAYPRTTYNNLEADSFYWPNGILPDGKIDLRTSGSRKKTYLTSHIFSESDKTGWATASNPDKKLLIGYIWKINEYPWLNVWHQSVDGKVVGRAIEFATCGVGLGFKELITGNYTYFANLSFEFIDAGQTLDKTYYMFAMEIPAKFLETTHVFLTDETVIVQYATEKGEVEKIFSKFN